MSRNESWFLLLRGGVGGLTEKGGRGKGCMVYTIRHSPHLLVELSVILYYLTAGIYVAITLTVCQLEAISVCGLELISCYV